MAWSTGQHQHRITDPETMGASQLNETREENNLYIFA